MKDPIQNIPAAGAENNHAAMPIAVTVIMATRNRETYIGEAINSILEQSFRDFELIIVDDASTDNTQGILEHYRLLDPRIRVIRNESQKGISFSRNLAYSFSSGKYIAVIDDDDISLPNRLEKQFIYLESNPEIAVVGSQIEVFRSGDCDDDTPFQNTSWVRPFSEDMMSLMLCVRNYICHSSTMIRKAFLDEHGISYNENILCGVDYDLWYRVLINGGLIVNLPEILTRYRVHKKSITASKNSRTQQDIVVDEIRINLLSRFFDTPKDAERFYCSSFKNFSERKKLKVIKKLNKKTHVFDDDLVDRCIAYQRNNRHLSPSTEDSRRKAEGGWNARFLNRFKYLYYKMMSLITRGQLRSHYRLKKKLYRQKMQ